MQLVNIGFGNMISAERMIAIVSPESAPIKRIVQDSRERGALIDATCGRKTRTVIIMDSDHVVLSALQLETVANRFNTGEKAEDPVEAECINNGKERNVSDEKKRTACCRFIAFRRRQGDHFKRIFPPQCES